MFEDKAVLEGGGCHFYGYCFCKGYLPIFVTSHNIILIFKAYLKLSWVIFKGNSRLCHLIYIYIVLIDKINNLKLTYIFNATVQTTLNKIIM